MNKLTKIKDMKHSYTAIFITVLITLSCSSKKIDSSEKKIYTKDNYKLIIEGDNYIYETGFKNYDFSYSTGKIKQISTGDFLMKSDTIDKEFITFKNVTDPSESEKQFTITVEEFDTDLKRFFDIGYVTYDANLNVILNTKTVVEEVGVGFIFLFSCNTLGIASHIGVKPTCEVFTKSAWNENQSTGFVIKIDKQKMIDYYTFFPIYNEFIQISPDKVFFRDMIFERQ